MLAAIVLSALLALLGEPQAPATPNPPNEGPQDDRSGKGAVLCAWHVYATALQVGERCHRGKDADLQQALRQGVSDIDAFIVRHNRPAVTAAQVAEIRTRGFRETEQWMRGRGEDICRDPDMAQFYGMVKQRGAAGLREDVAELLSVPRQPVMNPCF